MVSVREWEQSAAEWGRRAKEATARKDYEEARRCLGRAKRHALCAVRLLDEYRHEIANVATYADWFPDLSAVADSPIVAQQQGGDWIDDFEAGNAAYAASFAL